MANNVYCFHSTTAAAAHCIHQKPHMCGVVAQPPIYILQLNAVNTRIWIWLSGCWLLPSQICIVYVCVSKARVWYFQWCTIRRDAVLEVIHVISNWWCKQPKTRLTRWRAYHLIVLGDCVLWFCGNGKYARSHPVDGHIIANIWSWVNNWILH